MITFNKIRYKNILAVANDFIELDLDRSKTTMILGKNGSGKTTFITALVFALYGKTYIKVNKNQLVNSVTNKDLLVEVDFTIGSNKYMVRRGIKPNVFEVYKNGKLIEVHAKISDYQDFLEKTILKIDYKAFIQVIVLGSTNYIPFMELSAGDRRAVVEDLLDIQIFSIMNKILKQKSDYTKRLIKSSDVEIDHLQKEIDLTKKHILELQSNTDEMINQKKSSIKDLKSKVSTAVDETDKLQSEISKLLSDDLNCNEKKLGDKKDKLKAYEVTFNNKVNDLSRDIQFFKDNDDCPTCTQSIDSDFKLREIKKKTQATTDTLEALDKLKTSFDSVSKELNDIKLTKSLISEKNLKIRNNVHDMKSWSNSIEALLSEIEEIKTKNSNIDSNHTDLKSREIDLKEKVDEKYKLIEKQEVQRVSASLLKDDGIKKNAVKKYIPTINMLVNKYLADLDFFIQLELDDQFNETIKSRNRDIFSYSNFSEGQKSRISLALLFTWRELARIRNSASTNLLIMDEVFDGSLDDEGTTGLLKIISDLSEKNNIFVITHTPDKLFDKFHSTIEFELHRGFTRMVTE